MKSHNYSGSEFSASGGCASGGKVQPCRPLVALAKAGRWLEIIIIILFLSVFPFSSSSGKVFWSRLFARGQSIFDATAGWRRIYQAPLTINGGRATLSIYGCDEPLKLLKIRLKHILSSSKKNYFIDPGFAGTRNENSFWMLSTAGNHIARLLALAMPGADKSLIMAIDQSPAEFSKSTVTPSENLFADQALLAEGRVETTIRNDETGASLATGITDLAPDIIAGEITAKLSRRGWKQVYSVDNCGVSKQRFLIFQRGEALCVLLAGPALHENKSCVTILLKEKTDNMGK